MEQNVNENYTIDLSYAASASDIVHELSTIIDNDIAKNKHVVLKLGNVDLNQSQLLSIRSLISSTNSVVEVLETNSEQTELAAINLGIVVSAIKETVQPQITEVEPEEPTYVQSYGYVKLEDHLLDEEEEEKNTPSEDVVEETEAAHKEEENLGFEVNEKAEVEDKSEESPIEVEDIQHKSDDETTDSWKQRNADVELEGFAQKAGYDEEEVKEEVQLSEDELILKEEIHSDCVISDEQADEIMDAKTEDIQEALDNIYTSEVKLESILENEHQEEEGVISAEVVQETIKNEEKYTEADFEIDHFATMYIKQTLRSGQIVNYDGNVVIIGDCHPGSEVMASGDITVWGILSGIAHAGAKGNPRAKVRALKMNAIQLRIANCYARKPDGMNTIFPERTSTFTPEEARIMNDEIVIFKIND